MRFIAIFLAGVILTQITAAPGVALQPPDEAAKLTPFFQEFLDKEFAFSPLYASKMGDHRFADQLDYPTAEARADRLRNLKKGLAEMPKKIDYAKLPRTAQIDLEIFRFHLQREIWQEENTNPYETDPRLYTSIATECTYAPLSQSTRRREDVVRDCAARMPLIPRVLELGMKTLKNPPKVFVETAIKQNAGAISYYESGIYQLAGETPATSPLTKHRDTVLKALRRYQEFLEKELLPRATGEWRIGKDKFAKKLEFELDAGMSADEVLKEAETEADRVEREMYVIARQMWASVFPDKTLPPDDAIGRRLAVRMVLAELAKKHGKPETLLDDAKKTAEDCKRFIAKHDILRLPAPDRCRIIEMPEFQRGNWIAYLNNAPPLDTKADSYYAISPPPKAWDDRKRTSFLEEYNDYMLHILTIHEAYPGHYVQLEYANRHPSLIRRVLSSGIFAEGWAVYTEQMMLDQGYGRRHEAGEDKGGGQGQGKELLALRLHQLKFYLRAVVNAILDHKMHCGNMSDEEAMTLLVQRAFQSEGEAALKVIRAKQTSCQLSTYFVGRMAFYRLRQSVQREMGDKFELGRYHEAALAHGSLPVKYLPEVTRERLKQPR
jgi:uncharacterized protein (DUF885 family)